MGSWELNVINSKFVGENTFEKGFPCDNHISHILTSFRIVELNGQRQDM